MLEGSGSAATSVARSGLRDILALLAGGRGPLQVGDIALDEDGRIQPRSGDAPIRFCFAYRGVDFAAQIQTAPQASIILAAELGKMPYSMEMGIDRRLVRRIVEATTDIPDGRIELSDMQDMSIVATARPPLPLTPSSIMAAIATILLAFGPYIDLLRKALGMDDVPAAGAPATSLPLPESSPAL